MIEKTKDTMLGNKPLVSIICGYYNRKENLENSINSILEQSYENFEFLVFDDCSTDGTRELLQQFKHPKLQLIKHELNIGFVKGIIHAISLAKGEYIAIHGAGDISFKTRIEKQVILLNSDPELGIVGCLLEDSSEDGKVISTPLRKGKSDSFTQGEVMYRTNLYYMIGGYNPFFTYGQFTPLKCELLKFSKAGFVNEVLYQRIHFKNGVTKNNSKRIQQEIYYTIGMKASEFGILKVDISEIILEVSLRRIALLKSNSLDEDNFIFHAKNNAKFTFVLYCLFKWKIIPMIILRKYGTLLRKIRENNIFK